MQELFYVEPLLLSYESKITKLEEMVAQLNSRAGDFEEKAYQLTSENDFLREELEEKCKVLLEKEGSVTGMDVKYLRLENEGLREKEQLIKEENATLKKQILKLKDQLETLSKDNDKTHKWKLMET